MHRDHAKVILIAHITFLVISTVVLCAHYGYNLRCSPARPVQTSKRYAFVFLCPWPWPDDLDIWTWLTHSEDVPACKTELSRSSFSTVTVQTMTNTQTQTDSTECITTPYLRVILNVLCECDSQCCRQLIFCSGGNRLSLWVWLCVLGGRWRHWPIVINTWRLQLNNSNTALATYKQTSCCLMKIQSTWMWQSDATYKL